MNVTASHKIFTVEEYTQHEWTAPFRSELIDEQLFEMSGQKDINNQIAGNFIYSLFSTELISKGYSIYAFDIKVKIYEENKYYYPEVFVTKEPKTEDNQYIKYEPLLIAEIVSEESHVNDYESHVNDYVNKYIDYTKIPSLDYYLIIEPETTLIVCYWKGQNGEWTATKYTNPEDVIKLDAFNISFPVTQIYS